MQNTQDDAKRKDAAGKRKQVEERKTKGEDVSRKAVLKKRIPDGRESQNSKAVAPSGEAAGAGRKQVLEDRLAELRSRLSKGRWTATKTVSTAGTGGGASADPERRKTSTKTATKNALAAGTAAAAPRKEKKEKRSHLKIIEDGGLVE